MYVCKYVFICTEIHVELHTMVANFVETAGYHSSAKYHDFEGFWFGFFFFSVISKKTVVPFKDRLWLHVVVALMLF